MNIYLIIGAIWGTINLICYIAACNKGTIESPELSDWKGVLKNVLGIVFNYVLWPLGMVANTVVIIVLYIKQKEEERRMQLLLENLKGWNDAIEALRKSIDSGEKAEDFSDEA